MAEVKYLDNNGLATVWSKVKGIVTPKADKVSGATAGHLAGLNSSGNLTDSGLAADNVAQKNGSYSGMTVGAAEDLVSAESVASEFTYRVTGGSTAVGKGGTALLDRIKGRTLVWNQNVNTIDYNPSVVTLDTSVTTEKKYNYISTATSSRFIYGSAGTDVPAGHKVLIQLVFKNGISGGAYFRVRNGVDGYENINLTGVSQGVWGKVSAILNNGYKFGNQSGFIASGDSVTGDYFSIPNNGGLSIFDLTLMFGEGNEPATPEEFEALYPRLFYDYNPGILVSNAATAIETVGWNIWDEEWERGNISSTTGQNGTSTTLIRSKNSIKMIPGVAQYYLKAPTPVYFRWYDSNGNYIHFDTNYDDIPRRNEVFAPRTGAAYLRFVMTETAYGNNISISVSNSERNGTYEPHWRSELDLNIPTLTGKLNGTGNSVVIFPDGLRSAGTVFDEIVGNKAIKRIGKRSYASGDNEDVTLITDGTNTYYPLATPEEYILDDAIPTAMRNDPYGTEERLPADTSAIVTAPFRADITYATNIKEAVQSLPQNYINVNSMQDFLAALSEQMGGTWTMRMADGKFDFTFTPNPSNE